MGYGGCYRHCFELCDVCGSCVALWGYFGKDCLVRVFFGCLCWRGRVCGDGFLIVFADVGGNSLVCIVWDCIYGGIFVEAYCVVCCLVCCVR